MTPLVGKKTRPQKRSDREVGWGGGWGGGGGEGGGGGGGGGET